MKAQKFTISETYPCATCNRAIVAHTVAILQFHTPRNLFHHVDCGAEILADAIDQQQFLASLDDEMLDELAVGWERQ
jgi:deoxycytidylate deaminase